LEEALESPLQEFIEDGGLNGLEEALEGPLEEIIEDGGLGALEEALESRSRSSSKTGADSTPTSSAPSRRDGLDAIVSRASGAFDS